MLLVALISAKVTVDRCPFKTAFDKVHTKHCSDSPCKVVIGAPLELELSLNGSTWAPDWHLPVRVSLFQRKPKKWQHAELSCPERCTVHPCRVKAARPFGVYLHPTVDEDFKPGNALLNIEVGSQGSEFGCGQMEVRLVYK
uniref:15.7 kDa putative secretory protein n=1 Tax=Argas monolakensis TaxID=34602 RepID=Q09JQ6_ARGMO|nr:15.7 kDa putative secretory protein [Argas monolakensis]